MERDRKGNGKPGTQDGPCQDNSVDEIAFGIMAEILLVKNNGSLTHRKNK